MRRNATEELVSKVGAVLAARLITYGSKIVVLVYQTYLSSVFVYTQLNLAHHLR